MPKLKTHRGASKRFTARGKSFKHRRAYRSHILSKMSRGQKRHLRSAGTIHASDEALVRRMLRN